jgi:hypothetical protein
MNIQKLVNESLIGKTLVTSEFHKPEYPDEDYSFKGKVIKKTYLGMDECREDAVLWITFEDDSEKYFYLNDTLEII